ncbi:uncharacterized protein LOC131321021 [Rhododendron vialii]|uniref:uncharacterized protein LOC131321021 n=1 Tax=Rhododendron vialii TaxID=182163 RepID=UPI00265F95F1|nr:uncharacterized protein LOC131321021 [Rhododendron vialii]XP_058207992.1 uncharacterized protein LOC131321021 [Rhododendron vialii]XP_058207993.1 uncharacterized protein LOC131321021 [Rhododendron vialii]XP_058207994.1 uncharacterized protein LOC131321021 [Rhododendron vialii]XP_058207996.1 uncharacterized protein LOC131321021 [Rhododendron vialii]
MDLEDLDGLSRVPSRINRFAPKNSKLKAKSEPQELHSLHMTKKEEMYSIHDCETTNQDDCAMKMDVAVKMDVEAKSEGQETKDETMEEVDDDDRVVREIDVFFTPQIDPSTQLYVLQFPLRPCWRPYELDERCEEVRIKPSRADVEVDLSIDVDSKNYDTDADPRVRMTKQTLSSSMKPTSATSYAVGVLVGNKLHINPIRAVVQLRPSMEHLKSDGSKKNSVMCNVEATIKMEDPKDEKSAGPSKKVNKLPGTMNDDLQESWMTLKYHSSKSDYSIRYLRKMEVEESAPIQFSMSPYDYVSSLCPSAFNDNMKSQGPSTRFLRSLTLEERFKIWFREGPPANRLRTLKKHLAPDDSIEDVLGVLQKLAHLVQGLWIPKTPLLLEGGVECLARDYFLLLFSKNPVISYEQVKAVGSRGQPLKDVIKRVLSILAVERPDLHGWKFKELPDVSSENESSDEMFMKLYSDVVKEQEKAWERAEKPLTDSIFVGGRGGLKNSSKPDTANRAGTSKVQNKGAARSSNGAVSRTPMSNETREALPKVLQKLFQTHSVCSFQLICQRLREMAISESTRPKGIAREVKAAAIALDAPQEELLDLIGQVAINIHGVYVSKSSIDPQYDPLRKIVIDLLIAEGPNAKLKRAAIVEAAKMQLNQDISPNAYQKVLNELCVSQGSAWVLKRGDGNPK